MGIFLIDRIRSPHNLSGQIRTLPASAVAQVGGEKCNPKAVMEKTLKAHRAVSLFLILRIVFTAMPISAAELTPEIGSIASIGPVIVNGSLMDSGKLLEGDHIRTSDL